MSRPDSSPSRQPGAGAAVPVPSAAETSPHRSHHAAARVRRRQRSERLFRLCGGAAISVGLLFVVALFASIIGKGYPAFWQTQIRLDIDFSPTLLGTSAHPSPKALSGLDYTALVRDALSKK